MFTDYLKSWAPGQAAEPDALPCRAFKNNLKNKHSLI